MIIEEMKRFNVERKRPSACCNSHDDGNDFVFQNVYEKMIWIVQNICVISRGFKRKSASQLNIVHDV
jgi:hypothetical protein